MSKLIIRPETEDDYRNTETLTREAFWNVYRPGCMEHYVLHCYRNDQAFVPELDLVMVLDGEMIGQVIYVRSEIVCDDGRRVPIKTKGVRYADDPEADYLLIRELEPGFLNGISGTYRDPAGYFVCETDPEGFAQYEATFPPKERQRLPGQLF